jgi:hypothetical protein
MSQEAFCAQDCVQYKLNTLRKVVLYHIGYDLSLTTCQCTRLDMTNRLGGPNTLESIGGGVGTVGWSSGSVGWGSGSVGWGSGSVGGVGWSNSGGGGFVATRKGNSNNNSGEGLDHLDYESLLN